MEAEALSHVYGYGYESGRLPYSNNYNPNYDYPLPNWADPRWAPNPHSPTATVYAPQVRTIGAYGQVVRLAAPTPLEGRVSEAPPTHQNRRFWLLLGLGLLLVVLFVALDAL